MARMEKSSMQIEGQLGLFDKAYPVIIYGLMDDAHCPTCNYCFWETKEMDCDRCPVCGVRVDWTPWHMANDNEG